MKTLKVYDRKLNDFLQPKRLIACSGCVLLVVLCLFIGFEQTRTIIDLFFIRVTVTSLFAILSITSAFWFYLSYLVNLQNDRPLNPDERFEVSFYASLDSDIADFISRINSIEGRTPVLYEYDQIIGFANKKGLPAYHEQSIK